MSRVGKQIIPVPKGVEAKVVNGVVHVKGPKGSLTLPLYKGIELKIQSEQIEVVADSAIADIDPYFGLFRSLVNNMVIGVTKGFEQRLEMIGVGYRAAVQGRLVDVSVGFSHPTKIAIPEGVNVAVEKNTEIVVTGPNKQQVGQFAATLRAVRPPEPYQGKGIRYKGEYVRKKAGKAAAAKK